MANQFSLTPILAPQTQEAAPPEAAPPVAPQTGDVDIISPTGDHGTVPANQLQDAISQGYKVPTTEELQAFETQKKYSTPLEQLKTAGEGLGQGLAGPLFTGVETAVLGNEAEQRGRAEANPILHGATEVAGFVAPAIVSAGTSTAARAGISGAAKAASIAAKAAEISQAGLLEKAGLKAAQALNLGGKEASILSKIGAKSVSEATQMALLQSGDEVSKMIQNDPNQTWETAAADVGLAGVLGGGAGAAFGSVSPLWKATVGDKAAQLIEDFKGRIKFHTENPTPVQAVTDELSAHYNSTKAHADEVYGPTGLKAEAIANSMPEMHSGIPEQSQKFANQLEDSIVKMEQKPNSYPERLVSRARDDFEAYRNVIQEPNATPGEVFNATQDLKQKMQGYAKFDKMVKPIDEAYDFVREAKNMSHSLREGLEDTDVWGEAAKTQQQINKRFSEYLPTLKDFEKKFTEELGGEKVVSPSKVNTYLTQLGKPNAELKQTMLENFLKESEAYRNSIGDLHTKLGVESPVTPSSLAVTQSTLDKVTPGAKLADYFAKKGIYHLAGESLGTGIGGGIGALIGHPAIGAVVGERALAPFFSSVLPGLTSAFQKVSATSQGVKAAIDYGLAAAKGEALITKTARSVFKETGDNVIQMTPREGDRVKLDKALKVAQTDPMSMTKIGGYVGHFLPEHATAMAAGTANAVTYLNSLRPDTAPKAPLDSKIQPNKGQVAAYNRALDLANQPLLCVQSIKNGTLTPQDVTTLKTIYPSLYNKLSQKLTDEMITHVSKGDSVPYRQRLTLSLFTGQPLDSTMTQSAILAAQPKPQQQQTRAGGSDKPPAYNSVKGLNKMAETARTPGQTRAAARAVDKG